jgi:hypothetical protein
MSKTLGMRWLVVAAGAAMLLVLGAACTKEVEVPGETVIVEKEVVKTVGVEVPGKTVVVTKEILKVVEVRQGYVTDPTTGKTVSAPQYGGTLTSV